MSMRSTVAFAVFHKEEKVLQKLIVNNYNLFHESEGLFELNEIKNEIEFDSEKQGYLIKFYCEDITWNEWQKVPQQFEQFWQEAEATGCNGKFIEYCYDYPDLDNSVRTIGEGLNTPNWSIKVEI